MELLALHKVKLFKSVSFSQRIHVDEGKHLLWSSVQWLCNLAFTVDIYKYFSELNIELQGPNELLSSLLSDVKSFELNLKLWEVQEEEVALHFPTLQEQKPLLSEYAGECAKLLQAFGERFQNMKIKQKKLKIFTTS